MLQGRFAWILRGALVVGAVSLLVGCGSPPPPEPEVTQPEVTPPPPEPEPTPPPREEKPQWVDPNIQYKDVFRNINFEFNKYSILEKDKPTLEGIAGLMKQNASWKVLIEGHCDERGTNEYNMGLGEQRALAAKNYLADLGVAATRFTTISYGEERPLDPGHNEEAWAKNRRCQFRVEAPRP
jgi:peptidoglycan-associated lipoprotein